MAAITVRLDSVVDWPGFARAVRALRAEGVAPECVRWRVDGDDGGTPDLFEAGDVRRAGAMSGDAAMSLPRTFVDAAREVFLHADPRRLPLIHRLAARIADDARAWADPLHEDRLQFERLHREVRREIHKMHAFVRFTRVEVPELAEDGEDAARDGVASAASVRHVAWFEPVHHVLEAAAPFFARRFATMRWAILTPRASVEWDGRALSFGPGARQEDAPAADAGEALWLAYYRSIFNPARVKVAMMKKEMPVRFWKNLPEAATVPELLAQAPRREQRMVDDGGVARTRRRGQLEATETTTAPTGVPMSLDGLARQAARCRDCPGADSATQTVFGEGELGARVMLVGEQPGDQEDLRGKPFQGPAGQLLRGAIAERGWPSSALYLTNAVKHFHHELRGKRRIHKTPGQREAMACLHWLEAEIEALRPRAIVALGATAVRSLLGSDVAVTANEGRWLPRPDGTPVLVCLHPAAILRAEPSRQASMRQRWMASLAQADRYVMERVDEPGVAPA
ncbi:UdgX family uracil-DNA binding protein [Scleromatobacter humisilvae]|uniref:Type-4 uracil-DNA glycosylase n=1 Tax=Scleromatobacter humisilvae TaxID=2897159 RepID=A0A9X1YG99_9BURK|nr:UdgX family uracil-DNA binding protein [Scleromatobacter humisilvae]MCK9685167.1 UdgX family uracil-DNA binding protein [Scleromatobacter humisilvae]